MKSGKKSGGQLIVDALVTHGAEHVFCVPGESYLAVLDALHDAPLKVTVCRQEGGAAMMADAYGKLTGEPGICMVTRGPGATNASAGVHIAYQDSTPMILLIGQVGRNMVDREAFQEIDYRRMFGEMAKWVAQIDDAARIPEYLARAFTTATSGRPGPVVLALPEDMLRDEVDAPAAHPYTKIETAPGDERMAALAGLLERAERPFVIAGGSGWSAEACRNLQKFAEAWEMPVGVSFRCQDIFDNNHPNYAGDVAIGINPKLRARVEDADVLVVLGARLGEMTTSGYEMISIPVPEQKLIHVHPGAEELGRVYQPALAINAAMGPMTRALANLPSPASNRPWAGRTGDARQEFEAWTGLVTSPGPVQMSEIMHGLRDRLPDDAIICNGAGNYSSWVHRFHRYRMFGSQLAPTSGSMGYGTPAAVAAKCIHPERTVVAFAGDGCFMMNGQEFATAVQYNLGVIVIVINNAMYGTIRMHQEGRYPGRVSATSLQNPDFAALARAYGGHGETVEATEDFTPAFERAVASGKPAIIEIRIDPEVITPNTTLSEIRAAAEKN